MQSERLISTSMGSVGSGVAGEQEFAMKSVGTRTTLPRGPPLSHRGPSDGSFSTECLNPPPTISECTGSSDERGGSSTTTDRHQLAGCESTTASSNQERVPSNCERLESNVAGRRVAPRSLGVMSVDVCRNVVVHTGEKSSDSMATIKIREGNATKSNCRTPPKVLPMSGKSEQVLVS